MTRTPLRVVLPADLVDRLEAEADRRGVPVERMVEQALVTGLPRLWALILWALAARAQSEEARAT